MKESPKILRSTKSAMCSGARSRRSIIGTRSVRCHAVSQRGRHDRSVSRKSSATLSRHYSRRGHRRGQRQHRRLAGDRDTPRRPVVPVTAKGYGNALMGRDRRRRGKYIIMGDADDSYDFLEIPQFVEKLREGYDLVRAAACHAAADASCPARCRFSIAGGATRCSPMARGGFARRSTTSIAACAASPKSCTSGSICAAPGWNSRPR